jgi:hypothetical protein
MDNPPDEFYCWVDFESVRNFDVGVWQHFQVAVRFGVRRWMKAARCKLCGKHVGWSGCTGNLRKHLQIHHQEDIIPFPIRNNGPLKNSIEKVCHDQTPEIYMKTLSRLIQSVAKTPMDKQCSKFPVWTFYERQVFAVRTLRCRLCRRDVYWNQKGLEKLTRHVLRVHVLASQRAKKDELYRFCVILGPTQFIDILDAV